jgi:hypothetical protein
LVGLLALVAAAGAILLLTGGGPVTPTEALPPPTFVDETASSGINHVYDGDFEFFVGGGVAVFDCDEDGRQDLYIAGGSNPAALYQNRSETGDRLNFAGITSSHTDLVNVIGAYPLDVDSDGHMDLAVLRLGENVMLRGLGGCRFQRANETWGIDGGNDWTAAFSAKWEEGNTLPTLAFGNYLNWPVNRDEVASCADNSLFRPEGESYGQVTPLSPGWCTLSVLFADWDRSGRIDLRVANDRHYYRDGSEQLWRIAPGEEPTLYTAAEGWDEIQIWGMGVASQDVTGDGLPEFFVTSQADNKLRTLEDGADQPTYDDIAIRRGVTAHRPFTGGEVLPSTAWHPEFQDVNNDGFVDLFISKGNVEAMAEYAMADPNNLLLGQPDGTFEEGATDAGVASVARSRGAALADFNLDGLLDLVVVNRTENVQIWRNVGAGDAANPEPMGNWLAIQPALLGHNQQAVGGWIEVEIGDHTIRREISIGGGHAGDQLGWIHFGLGESDVATVRLQRPDDGVTEWPEVSANRFVILETGRNPQYWEPGQP